MTTKIEWTWVPDGKGGFKKGESWNCIRGCDAVSPACNNCYAEEMAGRFDKPGLWGHGLTVLRPNKERRWSGEVGPYQPRLGKPLHWRDPRGVFVNSTSDVWHERMMETEDGRRYIAAMFGVMAATPRHTYMILTKRPHLMREWFEWWSKCADDALKCDSTGGRATWPEPREAYRASAMAVRLLTGKDRDRVFHAPRATVWPLPNVWLGATTENQDCADLRIPDLLRTPAAVRFLSCEPLLGPVDIGYIGEKCDTSRISWVITGGESGRKKARPSHPDWFRSLRDQCTAAGVAHFFKQWGEWAEVTDDSWTHMVSKSTGKTYARGEDMPISEVATMGFMVRVGKKAAGRGLDGREWSEFPDV